MREARAHSAASTFSRGEQRAGRRRHVGLPHQAFADQDGADAGSREPRHVAGREDAALADEQPVGRDERREALGHGKRRLEGPEVAVVDAEQRRGEAERPLQLRLVMHLDEHVHAELDRGVLQRTAPRRR